MPRLNLVAMVFRFARMLLSVCGWSWNFKCSAPSSAFSGIAAAIGNSRVVDIEADLSDADRAEAMDEAQLDTILEKLHASGPESLSSAERTLLRRVSRRLRDSKDRGDGPGQPK